MAGVYIKGMKTPEKCEDCRFWDGHNNGCRVVHMITLRRIHQKKPDWCPLVDVTDANVAEWVPSTKYKGFLTCSACEDCYIEGWSDKELNWRYCPKCGKRMKREGV